MTSLKDLETLTYTEYINKQSAYKIAQNWVDILNNLPPKRQNKIRKSIDEGKDPLVHLKKIIKLNSDILHTKYNFSKNLKTYGRLFAENSSLSRLPREFRNCLADNKYYDIDMRNCHPVILSQYCKKNGIRCDILDKYIENRDELLLSICETNQVDKETAKQEILTIMNGGKGSWEISKFKGTFLHDFKQEISTIHNHVCRLNPEEFKKVKRYKDYNKEGTMMNILLCKEEHSILMNSVQFMRQEGFNVDVLVFDGFMVRKDGKEISNDTLKNLQKYIKEKTDYNMEFVEKAMENTIDLSKYADPVDDVELSSTYYKDKEEFEKTHLKLTHPSQYLTIMDDGTKDTQCETKIRCSYRHLQSTIIENKKVKNVKFIDLWLNDPNIRIYRKRVFTPKPLEYDRRDYNTWQDFKQESVSLPENFNMETNTYVQRYKEFIHNLFNGVPEYINFFIAWCANIIQNPAKRSCVCLVLYSLEEGAGKNMITKTLEMCLGEEYVNYISDVSNQLFGKHSSAEMDKLLIVLNEVKGKDTYANTDLFKTRITDDKREVELKGKDTMQINNYCSYILNTNNLNSVNAGDKDRRFCVLDCNNNKLSDKVYFQDYENEINKNPEAIRCIYEYLKKFNIEEIVPKYVFSDARPKTELYKDLVECNREKEWDFLEDLVCSNNDDDEMKIKNEDLWVLYRSYCNENHLDISKLSSKRFLFIFNRTIITSLDKNEEYKESITQFKSGSSRGLKIDLIKLRKYFNIDLSIDIEPLIPVKKTNKKINKFVDDEN